MLPNRNLLSHTAGGIVNLFIFLLVFYDHVVSVWIICNSEKEKLYARITF